MKTFSKRIITAVLTLALVAMLCLPVLAAPQTATVSVNGTHTFALYQIFTGTYSGGKLVSPQWGQNGTGTGSAEAAAEELVGKDAKEAAKYLNAGSTPVATVSAGNPATVQTGYYIAKDVTTLEKGEAYSDIVVKVVGEDVTINPKNNSAPTFNKKVYDVNDTTEDALGNEMVKYDESGWQDSADFDIGDSVPMRLQGTVPTDIDKYAHYYYAFHDEMEQGLTFEKIENVYVNGVAVPAETWSHSAVGNKLDVVIKDLKACNVNPGDKVEVYYTATLNEEAHTGNYGEVNEAYLEYSANPQDTTGPEDEGYPKDTNKTNEDKVIVFTYKVVINKTDTEGNALAGAQFELYKKYKDGSEKPVDLSVNAEGTVFTAVGIDDGTYILKETKAPDGYNPIEDMEFTVTATHNPLWEGEGRTVILTALSGDKVTGDVATGTLAATIQNKSGTELPTTGGVGTVLLYVLGAALVIGAGVLLVTKFRVSKEQG